MKSILIIIAIGLLSTACVSSRRRSDDTLFLTGTLIEIHMGQERGFWWDEFLNSPIWNATFRIDSVGPYKDRHYYIILQDRDAPPFINVEYRFSVYRSKMEKVKEWGFLPAFEWTMDEQSYQARLKEATEYREKWLAKQKAEQEQCQ